MGRATASAVIACLGLLIPSASRSAVTDDVIAIRPGETLGALMPFGDPYETAVVFELSSEKSGPLAVEARSLDFNPRVKVSRIGPDGTITAMGEVEWGESGPRSLLSVETEAGARYRIEVQPVVFPHCGGAFEVSIAAGQAEPPGADSRESAYEAHLDAVRASAENSGKVECRLYALDLEASILMSVDGDYGQAMPVVEKAQALAEGRLGSDHLISIRWIDTRALLLFYMGAYGEAKPLAERYLALIEERLGPDHPFVAHALERLAWIHMRMLNYADAKPLVERSLAIKEKRFGPDHMEVVNGLNSLAAVVDSMGSAAEAVPHYERALAIVEKNFGPDHEHVATLLSNLAQSLMKMESYAKARPLLERSVAINEKALGPDHPNLAFPLHKLGSVLSNMELYAEARPFYERGLAIRESKLGPEHPLVSESLNGLASLHWRMGLYVEARSLYERSLAIREKQYGPSDPRVAWTLNDLGSLLDDMGSYAEARPLFDRALGIIEERYGEGHWRTAGILNEVGRLLWRTGSYAESKKFIERALELNEGQHGADSGSVAINLNELGLVLRDMGSYAESKALFERALAINEKKYGTESLSVALNLDNLASVLHYMGAPAEARPLLERALAIREKAQGPEHPQVAWILPKLGRIHLAMGSHAEARAYFERALAINEKHSGPDHPEVAWTLRDLAGALQAMGLHAEARTRYERSLAIAEKQLGSGHPLVAMVQSRYARLLARSGEMAVALETALSAEEIGREHLLLTGRTLAEEQTLRYALTRASGLDLALSIVAGGLDDPDAERRTWDALIRSRALVLDEMAARNRTVAEAARITRLADRLGATSSQLANLVVRGPGKEPPERYRALLDDAREQKRLAEEALAAVSSTFGEKLAREQIGWDAVAGSLPPKSALLSFALYRREELSSGSEAASIGSYLALVLAPGSREPAVVPLGAADLIDGLVSTWQGEAGHHMATGEAEQRYRDAASRLREKIWDPIASHLGHAQRVFVVPDGSLNLVNLAALPVGERAYLVEDGPTIHHLSAERDLVRSSMPDTGEGLLALGDPAFDDAARLAGAPTSSKGESMTASIVTKLAAMNPFRGDRSSCGDFESMSFERLPASEREVSELVGLWEKARGATADRLMGAAATETAFKTQAPGHRVLHLATHGFFLGGRCSSALESSRGVGGLVAADQKAPPPVTGENPLLLSGLALAGANHRASAGPGEDDGILTAEEIAAMDFSGVEWVVLSACDTGVGAIKAGEGVFGLRRAFKVAGAGALIMSLWSVGDEPARQWMEALYQARLARKLDTAEAVRAASLAVLRERRANGESTHPSHWGAFVAAGDWR